MRLTMTGVGAGGRTAAAWGFGLSVALLSSSAWAELPPDGGPDVEVTEAAREQFGVGVALLQDPDGARYEEAYRAFSKAYAESPSWKILGNLGVCALKLERFDEGIEAMTRYLKYGASDLSEQERSQFERDLKVMEATGGTLSLKVTGATSVTLRDTRTRAVGGPISNSYEVPDDGLLEIIVASGKHSLQVSAGGLSAEEDVSVDSGGRVEVAIELKPTATQSVAAEPTRASNSVSSVSGSEEPSLPSTDGGSGLRTAGFVVTGVGVAGLIGAGVTAGLGFSKKGKLNDDCPEQTCTFDSPSEKAAYDDDLKSLKTFGALTTAFAIGGGVLAAAGVTMIVVGGKRQGGEQVSLQLTPSIGPAWTGLSAQGVF